jgi:hypothetical protein
MAIFPRIIKLFKPLRSRKYALIQEQTCAQCGKHEYDHGTNRRASHNDLRSLFFGLVAGTFISLFFAGLATQWYISRIQHEFNVGHYPADDTFGKSEKIVTTTARITNNFYSKNNPSHF